MKSLTNPQLYAVAALLIVLAFIAIGLVGAKLANENGSDVRVVWYLFSLSVVCTSIAAIWATGIGAIDQAGQFRGEWGEATNRFLMFMLDLDTDIKVFAALLAIFVIPQVASYLLSGLFGCASDPLFVGRAVAFFVWSVVKSFVVASGILVTVAVYGWAMDWSSWNLRGAASMLLFSVMLLSLAFACLYIYRDIGRGATSEPTQLVPLRRAIVCIREWLTRKSSRRSAA